MTIAVVLGAGGAFGWVFHTGVLRALREQLGIDADSIDLLIGTSAGAAVAASTRAGVSPEAIYDSVTTPPSEEDRGAMREELRNRKRTFRPLRPKLVRHLFPGGNGFGVALAGMLPPGFFPTTFLERFPGMDALTTWPNGLWIPAVRADDGELVVFGRDRSDIAVSEAVQASSAVPGMFRPYLFEGVPYVDGGLASPTHADLVAAIKPDLVVISAPMAKPVLRPMAGLARRRLSTELSTLRAGGVSPVVIRPTRHLTEAAAGFPRRNPGAGTTIEAAAADLAADAVAAAGFAATP